MKELNFQSATHPEDLQELMRSGKYDVGFAFDGDADRLIAVNEDGELWIVIRTKQGAESTKKKLDEIFGKTEVIYQKKGYRIYKATKKTQLKPRIQVEAF